MTHEDILDEELPFRSDFAARVLNAADAVVGRRQNVQRSLAAVSVSALAGAVLFGLWRTRPVPSSVAARVPQQIASVDLREISFSRGLESPLAFMFPNAAALAEFSEQYGRDDADAQEDDAVFFTDTTDETEVDGS